MKNFSSALKEFKADVTGAACYRDPLTDTKHCANSLTKEEAEKFGQMHDLVLINWQAGKKCSQVEC